MDSPQETPKDESEPGRQDNNDEQAQSCWSMHRQFVRQIDFSNVEDHALPALLDGKDFGRGASNLIDCERSCFWAHHPWCSGRHAWKRYAANMRMLGEEPLHHINRHVAFDGISVDDHDVATLQLFGNAHLLSNRCKILLRVHFHVEAIAAQILGVLQATITVRISV